MLRPIPRRTSTLKSPTSRNSDAAGELAKRGQGAVVPKARRRMPARPAPLTTRGQIPPTATADSWAPTGRQAKLRRRSCGLSLKHAVRSAVAECFHFNCRAIQDEALWSATERVWLGKRTFLHWAMWLTDFDIPWAVATATGVPHDVEQLRSLVLAELVSYWADQLAALPRRTKPRWAPLP